MIKISQILKILEIFDKLEISEMLASAQYEGETKNSMGVR